MPYLTVNKQRINIDPNLQYQSIGVVGSDLGGDAIDSYPFNPGRLLRSKIKSYGNFDLRLELESELSHIDHLFRNKKFEGTNGTITLEDELIPEYENTRELYRKILNALHEDLD